MFAKLKGLVEEINDDNIIIDVNGVGYLVYISKFTVNQITLLQSAKLYIETRIREDDISLYGFASKIEKEWFNLLITVKGVGPKMALNIFSNIDNIEKLSSAILLQETNFFRKISGVGAKIAERIVLELKDKIPAGFMPTNFTSTQEDDNINIKDALSALITLGYNKNESYNIIKKITQNSTNLSTKDIIKNCLKELAK